MVIACLVLGNRQLVAIELFLLPPISAPLYAPVALAFALGLLIGLLYAAKLSLFRRK